MRQRPARFNVEELMSRGQAAIAKAEASKAAMAASASRLQGAMAASASRLEGATAAISRIANPASKIVKAGASAEGALALAGAGALYGIGKELFSEHEQYAQQEKMKKEGYTELSGTGSHTYLPGSGVSTPASISTSRSHSVSHMHGGVKPEVYSHGEFASTGYGAYSTPPGLQSPQPLGSWKEEPPFLLRETGFRIPAKGKAFPTAKTSSLLPTAKASGLLPTAKTSGLFRPVRHIKVKRFKIPKDKPYDLVQWEANTQAIANNMMSGTTD